MPLPAIAIAIAIAQATANSACDANTSLVIVSSTDDGLFEETHGPENAIDGDMDSDSRWSNQSQGSGKSLLLDLGAVQTIKSLNIAWYKGDNRKAQFSVEVSGMDQTMNHLYLRVSQWNNT